MTDTRLLNLLIDFQRALVNVSLNMLWARTAFERGEDVTTWTRLLEWRQAHDDLDAAYYRLAPYYYEALNIRDGFKRNRYD